MHKLYLVYFLERICVLFLTVIFFIIIWGFDVVSVEKYGTVIGIIKIDWEFFNSSQKLIDMGYDYGLSIKQKNLFFNFIVTYSIFSFLYNFITLNTKSLFSRLIKLEEKINFLLFSPIIFLIMIKFLNVIGLRINIGFSLLLVGFFSWLISFLIISKIKLNKFNKIDFNDLDLKYKPLKIDFKKIFFLKYWFVFWDKLNLGWKRIHYIYIVPWSIVMFYFLFLNPDDLSRATEDGLGIWLFSPIIYFILITLISWVKAGFISGK